MTHHLVLVRHGQTLWSQTGQHTGLTDVPLTAQGREQALTLAPALHRYAGCPVLSSPLERAWRTAELAGLTGADVEPDLVEWDYGGYEGLSTEQIRQLVGHPWTVFADGVVAGRTPGESLESIAARSHRVLTRISPLLEASDVVLVGHGHALRVLAACWLQLPPRCGAQLSLDPASVSVLGHLHEVPAIMSWNHSA